MEPLAIHHVSVNVTDVERGVRFYTEILGGVLRADRPALGFEGAWIDLGTHQVHLLHGIVPPHSGQHFAIRVEDLDAAVGELRSKAVEVSEPAAIGTGRQAFTSDPDGNGIELHQVSA